MAKEQSSRGRAQDRAKVAAGQEHEVEGNSRAKVEDTISGKK